MEEMVVATYTPPVSPVVVFLKPWNTYKISNKAIKPSPEEVGNKLNSLAEAAIAEL